MCSSSKGEQIIEKWLNSNNVDYTPEYKQFKDLLSDKGNPLRFDFAIFENTPKTIVSKLIEFDGEQHYRWIKGMMTEEDFKKLQYHDQLKNEYCLKNNIPLIRIPYYNFDNIEQILTKELQPLLNNGVETEDFYYENNC